MIKMTTDKQEKKEKQAMYCTGADETQVSTIRTEEEGGSLIRTRTRNKILTLPETGSQARHETRV